MKNIKHSKFKNTGFIFELLVRQITSEIMSGKTNSKAEKILKEYFSAKKELSKELCTIGWNCICHNGVTWK